MQDQVLEFLRRDSHNATERLREFLTIPSVSTDPAFKSGVAKAGQWVASQFEELGLNVEVCPTPGHPIVLARTRDSDVMNAGPDTPHVLFYGHYDVQPPDPMELWTSPPFQPAIRNGAIYARGASDDKGQVLCFIEALRSWRKSGAAGGKFPVHLTVLIEGEEEMGSKNLVNFIQSRAADLKADVGLISDTAMWDRDTPAITYALRGLLYFDIQLHGPNRDLHSGVYGGTLANPATMLAQVLGRLFDANHRVTVPGFYDDVVPVSDAERKQWATLGFSEKDYLAGVGVKEAFGEAGFATLERRWCRPACDINGLYGGYGGPGAKTVLPSFAGAKVSFRLAPNQSAAKIGAAFRAWLEGQNVHGCTWKITDFGGSDAVMVSTESPYIAAASRAIEKSAGRKPVLVREGATIPVVGDFKRLLGLDTLLIGFGLPDDCIHSPNEKFDLNCFALGCRTHAVLLAELAGV